MGYDRNILLSVLADAGTATQAWLCLHAGEESFSNPVADPARAFALRTRRFLDCARNDSGGCWACAPAPLGMTVGERGDMPEPVGDGVLDVPRNTLDVTMFLDAVPYEALRAPSPICIPNTNCGIMSEGSARRITSWVDGYAETCRKRETYRSRFFSFQRITLRQTLLPKPQAAIAAENIDASEPKIIRSSKVITSFPGQKTQGRRTRLADTAFIIHYTEYCGQNGAPSKNTPCIPYSCWSIVVKRAQSAQHAGSDRLIPGSNTKTDKQSRRRESQCSNATGEPQKSGGGGGSLVFRRASDTSATRDRLQSRPEQWLMSLSRAADAHPHSSTIQSNLSPVPAVVGACAHPATVGSVESIGLAPAVAGTHAAVATGRRGRRPLQAVLLALALLMVCALALAAAPRAFADEGEPDFTISTASEFKAFADAVNATATNADYTDKLVVLAADIDLSDYSPWAPIGFSAVTSFKGTFDGQGHTISGLNATTHTNYHRGLFGYMSQGGIKNLVVKGTVVSNKDDYVGGVLAHIQVTDLDLSIENVGFEGTISGSAYTNAGVGGVVGRSVCTTATGQVLITNCYNKATITDERFGTYIVYVGGIVGRAEGLTLRNCYNLGEIRGDVIVGGLVGGTAADNNAPVTVANSYNEGTVGKYLETASPKLGALVGQAFSPNAMQKISFTDSYYLFQTGLNANGDTSTTLTSGGGYGVTAVETPEVMQQIATVTTLNTNARQPSGELYASTTDGPYREGNNWPVLAWERSAWRGSAVIQEITSGWAKQNQQVDFPLQVKAALPDGEKDGCAESTNTGTLSYEWFSCGADGTNADSLGAGAAIEGGSSYTPSSTDTLGTSYYFCRITNAWTSGSQTVDSAVVPFMVVANLTPETPVLDSALPADVRTDQKPLNPPTLFVDSAEPEDGSARSYQWYVAESLDGEGVPVDPEAISSETTVSYVPSLADIGTSYYFCRVTNTLDRVNAVYTDSRVATFEVIPIYISSATGLKATLGRVNFETSDPAYTTFEGATLVLTADIDLENDPDTLLWEPIRGFRGIFDGTGHTISGLNVMVGASSYYGGGYYAGLFGSVTGPASIRNLVVSGEVHVDTQVYFNQPVYAAGVVGNLNASSNATIENVGFEGEVTSTKDNGSSYVGGVVGYIAAPTAATSITGCYNRATVSAGTARSNERVNASCTGGIVGSMASTSNFPLIGNCYNTGAISGNGMVGGIIGGVSKTGTAGTNYLVQNCYNTGSVVNDDGITDAGAITGSRTDGSFSNNFYLSGTGLAATGNGNQGGPNEGAATPLNREQLSASTLIGDSAGKLPSTAWYLGNPYPVLLWEKVIVPGAPIISLADGWTKVGTPAPLILTANLPSSGTGSDGELSYEWFSCNADGSSPASKGAGKVTENGSSYTPSAATLGDTYYYCVVTNTWTDGNAAATSDIVRFRVTPDAVPPSPQVSISPEDIIYDLNVANQPTPTFTVTASATAPAVLSYQWYQNTLRSNTGGFPITDATDASYTPQVAATVGTNFYYCVVTSTIDGVNSTSVASGAVRLRAKDVEIWTAADLKAMSDALNNQADAAGRAAYRGHTVELMADIQLGGPTSAPWVPIGHTHGTLTNTAQFSFRGTFEGNGHTISGLYVDNATGDYSGLFGYMVGTVRNLTVIGEVHGSTGSVGGVLAYGGTLYGTGVVAQNVAFIGDVTSSGGTVGGIMGYGSAAACYHEGTVSGASGSIGGVLGSGGIGTIAYGCYNRGTVVYTGASEQGARIGGVAGSGSGSLIGCYSAATVIKGNADVIGGISATGNTTAASSGNYYRTGSLIEAAQGSPITDIDLAGATPLPDSDMKLPGLVEDLNAALAKLLPNAYYAEDEDYPHLYWESTTVTQADLDSLAYAIAQATDLRNQYVASEDGTDVPTDIEWVLVSFAEDFEEAIATAQAVLDSSATETLSKPVVGAASTALWEAYETFNRDAPKQLGTYTPPPPANLTALNAAISAAQQARAAVTQATDGSQLDPSVFWAPPAAFTALNNAIATAQGVAQATSPTQTQVDNARGALETATATFNAARKPGTKQTQLEEREWPRLDGNKGESGGRYDTMQAIVNEGWKDTGSPYVIVASGANFPDALAASSLAGIYGAPVVLTATDTLTPQAEETIRSLNASRAYVIGGPAAVSDTTLAMLEAVVGAGKVSRIYGDGRIETALDIYEKGRTPDANHTSWGNTAIIANGFSFADALSISPFANVTRSPIFLSDPNTGLNDATLSAINNGGFTKAIIVGGAAAVPESVVAQLAPSGIAIDRWWGAGRYETSADIVTKSLLNSGGKLTLANIVCATGSNYPDALAGGAFAGHKNTVLLLVHATDNGGRAGIESIIKPRKDEIGTGYVLGGTGALPDDLLALLQEGAKSQ